MLRHRQTVTHDIDEATNAKRDKLRKLPTTKDDEPDFFRAAKEAANGGRTLLGRDRLYTLWQALSNARHAPGALVEVGTYRGGSAFFLARAMAVLGIGDRRLHVVDTFEGHPSFVSESDRRFHPPGHFGDTSFEEVRDYLRPFPFAQVHKGAFEDICDELPDKEFCFAHIDVDTYVSTKNCLAYLDRHLSKGGVVVLDDFGASKCPGVKRAADEFLAGRWEAYRLVRLYTEQALLFHIE